MFRIKVDPTTIKNIVNAVATITDEATIHMTPEGLKIREMDPSRVAMVDLELPKDFFKEYEVPIDTKVSISFTPLSKLLKRAQKNDTVEITEDEPKAKLKISFQRKSVIRDFTMPTLEPMSEEVPTPKVSFNVVAKILPDIMKNMLEDADIVSSYVYFNADSEKLFLKAIGDVMTADIELKKGSDSLLDLNVKEPSKAAYSLSYLAAIMKDSESVAEIVKVGFTSDMPIKLEFEIANGGRLTYYLAPRIEVE